MSQSSFGGFVSNKPNKGGTNTGDATATAADISSGLTAYVLGVKLTGTGANAKKYASGTVVASAASIAFTDYAGATQNSIYVTVSGLNFPNGIECILLRAPSTVGDITVYNANVLKDTNAKSLSTLHGAGTGAFELYVQMTGNAFVTNTGFQLPVWNVSGTYNYEVWGV